MEYLEQLAREISESGLFDEKWYVGNYRDVALVGLHPLDHFIRFGMALQRNPGPGFDARYYLSQNADVALSGAPAFLHYIRFGQSEGRRPWAGVLGDLGTPFSTDDFTLPARRNHAGARPFDPALPTILLCGHSNDAQLFGGERSLLDVLQAFQEMPVNIITTLPSEDNIKYLDLTKELCSILYAFPYKQWMGTRTAHAWSVIDFADIIARHGVDIVHVNTIVLLEPVLAAAKMGRTSVTHIRELISLDDVLRERMQQKTEDIVTAVCDRSDWLIGNSQATCRLFDRGERTLCVPNAVAIDELAMENHVSERVRFGIVSSNIAKKGIDDFIEIARRTASQMPQAQFVVVGPATADTERWRAEVSAGQRPDNLVFVGYQDNARDAMEKINVLLNLSTFGESFGRTVAEAMAASRPVIAYRWGALPELVQDGETGRLVPFQDIDAIADAVIDLCRHPERVIAMGTRARDHVAEHFSQQNLAARLADAYQVMLQRPMRNRAPAIQGKAIAARTVGIAPPTTIIIPIFNAVAEVRACIASVLAHMDQDETELLLIDDGSTDPAISKLLDGLAGQPGLRIVRSPQNLGYTRTINIGIGMAKGRDVVLLNSDTVVTPRWLEGLRAIAYSQPMVATVTAMSDNAGAFSFPLSDRKCQKPPHLTHDEYAMLMVQGTFDCPPPEVPTGNGFCLFIRRAALDACGLFDEIGFPRGYGEENDFCVRSSHAGWTHLISPWSFVFHVRTASFKGERDSLSKAGLAEVVRRYPDYMDSVQKAFASSAMMKLRQASATVLAEVKGV